MTELIEVNVANLSGAALDWAVGKVIDLKPEGWKLHDGSFAFAPSANWSQTGPLIEEHIECLESFAGATEWSAACFGSEGPLPVLHRQTGETPLIAACRAIVAAKLGDTVQVPKELI